MLVSHCYLYDWYTLQREVKGYQRYAVVSLSANTTVSAALRVE